MVKLSLAKFLFEYLIFDNPKFCKNTILTHSDTICVSKNAQNTIKLGEKQQNILDQFLTYNLDQFLTYKTPNLGPVFKLYSIYIYIYLSLYLSTALLAQYLCHGVLLQPMGKVLEMMSLIGLFSTDRLRTLREDQKVDMRLALTRCGVHEVYKLGR